MNNWQMQANGEKATISINGVIGSEWWEDGVTANQFERDLNALGDPKHIDLMLYTPGGSVVEGNKIFNLLVNHPASITAHIDFAASMGTVIAMAADEIVMAENAWFMIHNPWAGAMGESKDLRRVADLLDGMKSNIVKAYQRHAKLSDEEISGMMDDETWLSAANAKEFSFIDEISDADADADAKTAFKATDMNGINLYRMLAAALVFIDGVDIKPEDKTDGDANADDGAQGQTADDEANGGADDPVPVVTAEKASADAKAAYEEGEAAGLAQAEKLTEKATEALCTRIDTLTGELTTARKQAEDQTKALDKSKDEIDSMTAGFHYNGDSRKNVSTELSDHKWYAEIDRLMKEGNEGKGMTQQEAVVALDKLDPKLRLDLIKRANNR